MQGDEYSLASTSGLTYVAADWTALMRCCKAPPFLQIAKDALVAQLDRAPDYESGGREFESSRARHNSSISFPKHTHNHRLCRLIKLVLILTIRIHPCHSKKCPKSDQRVTEITLVPSEFYWDQGQILPKNWDVKDDKSTLELPIYEPNLSSVDQVENEWDHLRYLYVF